MSGFDPIWLALREPADARARNPDILAACAKHFSERAEMSVVDLGCGAGSNLRALAPHLPARQTWRLVDNDPRLLDAARKKLAAWADASETTDDGLRLRKDGKRIDVRLSLVDLARDLEQAVAGDVDLVTAAALFDLVSEAWLQQFVALLAARRMPLYTVLIYDGVEEWAPPHAADAAILSAFLRHQATDKGFGPAAGPQGAAIPTRLLQARGYAVSNGASDWRLDARDSELVAQLAAGIAGACRETGLVAAPVIEDWLAARRGAQARIGHVDLFAIPG